MQNRQVQESAMAEGKKIKNIGVLIGNFSTKHPMEVLRGLYNSLDG